MNEEKHVADLKVIAREYKGTASPVVLSEAINAVRKAALHDRIMDGDFDGVTDADLTELNRLVNGERGRRYRNRRCQFVGEFVYRNGNSETAQCSRKPHEIGSHTYNGAVIDQ
jgi:hypothetical protein